MNKLAETKKFFCLSQEKIKMTITLIEVMTNDKKATMIFLGKDQYYMMSIEFGENCSCIIPNIRKSYKYFEEYFLDSFMNNTNFYQIGEQYRNSKVTLHFLESEQLIEITQCDRTIFTIDMNSNTLRYLAGVMDMIPFHNKVNTQMKDALISQLDKSTKVFTRKIGMI